LDGAEGSHYLDRANHTGTQPIATVAGLQAALDSKSEDKLPSAAGNGGKMIRQKSDESGFEYHDHANSGDHDNRYLKKTGDSTTGPLEFKNPVLFRYNGRSPDAFFELDPNTAPFQGISTGEFRPIDLYDKRANGPSGTYAAGFEYLPLSRHWHTQVLFDASNNMYFRVSGYNATSWPTWKKVHHDGNSRQRIVTLWTGSAYTGSFSIAAGQAFSKFSGIIILARTIDGTYQCGYVPYDVLASGKRLTSALVYSSGWYYSAITRTSDTSFSVSYSSNTGYPIEGIYGVY
jgi:hypothetical protein